MRLVWYIAWKYFFSRSVKGVVHIISLISMSGIMVGAMAMIIILSAFNGFEEVVGKLFNTFEADLKVQPIQGKYFSPDSATLVNLRALPGVRGLSPIIEENVLLRYRESQSIATVKALDPAFMHTLGLDSTVYAGAASLLNGSIMGSGVASRLDISLEDAQHPVSIYLPKRGKVSVINPLSALNKKLTTVNGVFSVQQDFDTRFVLLSLEAGRELAKSPVAVTSVEIALNPMSDGELSRTKSQVLKLMGSNVRVLDRKDQQPLLYKVMRIERLMVFLVLSFILLIAAANLVGALLMLALEKRRDMSVLSILGATPKTLRNVLLVEGMLLSVGGGTVGIILGGIIAWLQKTQSMVKITQGETFVIQAYPIAFRSLDFLMVFAVVLVLGFLASYYPALTAARNLGAGGLRTRRG